MSNQGILAGIVALAAVISGCVGTGPEAKTVRIEICRSAGLIGDFPELFAFYAKTGISCEGEIAEKLYGVAISDAHQTPYRPTWLGIENRHVYEVDGKPVLTGKVHIEKAGIEIARPAIIRQIPGGYFVSCAVVDGSAISFSDEAYAAAIRKIFEDACLSKGEEVALETCRNAELVQQLYIQIYKRHLKEQGVPIE